MDKNAFEINTKQIYFILPSLKTSFTHNILNGICDFCDDNGLDVSIKITKGKLEKENQYINSAITTGAKGIILFPADNETVNNEVLKLSANRYPLTIIDRYFNNVNASFVASDNYNAMIEAIKFLHSKKHEKIVFLSSKTSLASSVKERLDGFNDGIKKFYGNNKNAQIIFQDTFVYDEIYEKFSDYLSKNPIPDVIICPGVKYITDSLLLIFEKIRLSMLAFL